MLPSLIQSESGGNWQAQNSVPGAGGLTGHFGRLQFGQARLQDAMNAGVIPVGTTPEQFMANPQMQMAVEQWHFSDIDRRAQELGLNQYIGQTVGGAPITQDAIRAMAHLGGIGGAQRFLETGGRYNPSDAFGTSLLDYALQHGGDMQAQPTQPQGLLGTVSTSNPVPQQPAEWSIWDAIAGRLPERAQGIAGRTIGNADWRDRMAIALAGMSMRPNTALIETLQGRMDDRAQTERVNQTVQWLQSIGRTDLAEAVAAGSLMGDQAAAIAMQPPEQPQPIEINGQLVDPVTGAVIGDYRTPEAAPAGYTTLTAEETSAMGLPQGSVWQRSPDGRIEQVDGSGAVTSYIATGDAAASLGLDPANSYNIESGPEGMRATRIGGDGTTVTVNNAGQDAFSTETGKLIAQETTAIVQQGAAAQRNLGLITTLETALAASPQGFAGALTQIAGQLGIKADGVSQVELADAIISQLVPQQRPPGSGTMSDADLALFRASLPNLMNTPQGNAMIIQTMRAVAEYDVKRGEIADRLRRQQITQDQAAAEYAALGNPLAAFVEANTVPEGETPTIRYTYDSNGNLVAQ